MNVDDDAASVVREMGLAVFESAGEAIVVTDLAGIIRYVNPSFERITGYSCNEAIGQTPRILKSGEHDESLYKSLWQTITSGETWRGSFLNRRKDGSLYHVEQTIAPVTNAAEKPIGYVSVHADVSQRKRLESDLREADIREARQQAEHQLHLAKREIEIARSVQQNLFPKAPPKVQGFEIAGAAFPADETCGDYYDFISMSDGTLGIVIADVSGHGLGPALLMVETRAYLRALAESHDDVEIIVKHANSFLVRDVEVGRFVTLFFARFDPSTRSLFYVGAGHDGYHLDEYGHATHLTNTGLPLGVEEDAQIPNPASATLNPGDVLLLTTDGIHESQTIDGTSFGIERLLNSIRAHRHRCAEEVIQHMYEDVRNYSQGAPQADDMTIVVIKALA